MADCDTDSVIDVVTNNNSDCKHKNSGPSVSVHSKKRKYSCKFNCILFSRADFSKGARQD